jgi:DNA-directed RNA polymerase subunit RPC12/RpoP
MKDANGRVFTCFICGKQFDLYNEYRDHIIDTHEEGREYIKCPACEAPVRDLKTHFSAKHPNRALPKNCQLRAVVWFDFKSGKKKTRKPKFREGYFESKKNNCSLHYRSGYECEVYELLEQDGDVVTFAVEPYKVPYYHEGKWLEYIPDLRVNYMGGKVEIWEIKPSTQTRLEKNKDKWKAMEVYAEKLGWQFKVITETEIGRLRVKIKQQRLINEIGT